MDTIVIDNKRFVIKKGNKLCNECLFYHNNNYPKSEYHCLCTRCYHFIVIREVNMIDKIRMWFKNKIKK